MSLWQWQELLEACCPGRQESGPVISGICIDSRMLNPGDLFIALSGDPGPKFQSPDQSGRDGHMFLSDAVQRGAAALMVSRAVDVKCPTLRVDDTLDGLWQLGKFARHRMRGKVVAITGSSGKTTARAWIEQLLASQARTHASIGSLNNHWGVPLSLARMPANSQFGVFEVGTSHPGEIAPLASMVNADVALLLNVLPAHIGYFGNLEAIRREKLTITSGLSEAGVAIVPQDLNLDGLKANRVVTFALGTEADVCGAVKYGVDHSDVEASVFGQSVHYRLRVGGEHRVLTSLAALAVIGCLGADISKAAAGFSELTAPIGRGNVVSVSGIRIIDDSYNANPVSMAYAIEALSRHSGTGKRIAVLGEMLELGRQSDRDHADIMAMCHRLDDVITVGEGFASCPGSWAHVDNVDELPMEKLRDLVLPGDVILVKGSNKVFWKNNFVERLVKILDSG